MKRSLAIAARIVGFGLHAIVGFFYLASGLVVPRPVVVVLVALWLALLAAMVIKRRQAWFVLGVPLAAAALWVVVVQGGSSLFGWTA